MFSWPIQSELTKTMAFVYKNWVMAMGNIFTLFEILFWPLVGFMSVGLMTKFVGLAPEMKAFILIGIVSMSAIQVCQLDVSYVLLYDVWSKAIKQSFVAPMGLRHFLAGAFFMGVVRGTAVFLVLAATSSLFFRFNFLAPGSVIPTLWFLLGIYLCSAMVGVLVCILVLNFGNRAEIAAWSLVSLMLLVCGIYYPVSTLPGWAAGFAEFIPLTYFLEYFRSFHGFAPAYPHPLLTGYGMVLLYLAFEIGLLKRMVKKAKRTGMLLKLSE